MARHSRWVALAALLAACGGGASEFDTGAATPAGEMPGTLRVPDQAAAADTLPPPTEESLVRETFSYQGAARDPFLSLLKDADVRPLLEDLRLMTIIYDAAYPARSVAVLKDVSDGKRYRLHPGDVAGRLRVSQIGPRQVVFTVQEYGFERQETLSLSKREETP